MTKGKGLSIGAAMKNRMQDNQQQDAPHTEATSVEASSEELEPFNTRLPRGLHRRLKLYTVARGGKMQDVVSTALESYLDQEERKIERKKD